MKADERKCITCKGAIPKNDYGLLCPQCRDGEPAIITVGAGSHLKLENTDWKDM